MMLQKSLGEADVVVLEGFLLLAIDSLREQLDYKVFIDCLSDERLAFRLGKFRSGKYTQEETVREYVELVRTRHDQYVEPSRWHADLALNGLVSSAKGAEMLRNGSSLKCKSLLRPEVEG